MTPLGITLAAVIVAQSVAHVALTITILKIKGSPMPIPDDIAAQLSRIDTSTTALPAKVAAEVIAAENAAATQAAINHADILAGVTQRADAISAVVGS